MTSLSEMVACGVNVLGLKPNSKCPIPGVPWAKLQERKATKAELAAWEDGPFGVICGSVSGGLEVMDIEVQGLLEAISDQIPDLFNKMPIVHTAGGGFHIYYRCKGPKTRKLAYDVDWPGAKSGGLIAETRGEGSYVVGPGTVIDGRPYTRISEKDFDAIPFLDEKEHRLVLDTLNAFHKGEPIKEGSVCRPKGGVYTPDPINFDSPGSLLNATGSFDAILQEAGYTPDPRRDKWHRPGKEGNSAAEVSLWKGKVHLWHEGQRGYDKFGLYTHLFHNGDFTKAAKALADMGYTKEPAEQVDYSEYIPDLDGILKQHREKQGFPVELMKVPGFIGEFANYVETQNHRSNPLMALSAGIAMQSVLCGRNIMDRSGVRANLMIFTLANSGAGKQAPQSCMRKLMVLGGMSDSVGGKVTSDSAIAEDLMSTPCKLYIWDEAGKFLRKTAHGRGGAHLHAVQELLLELWGSTGDLWKHKSFANNQHNREVRCPFVTISGWSTPHTFWAGLESEHLDDGLGARMLVIEATGMGDRKEVISQDPSSSLVKAVRYWAEFQPGSMLATFDPTPLVVQTDPEAEAIFADIYRREDEAKGDTERATWARVAEKARKLALLYACSRDRANPRVDAEAASWGAKLSVYCAERFLDKAEEEVTDGSWYAEHRQRVLKILKGEAQKRHIVTRSSLLKKMKVSSFDLNRVIDTMLEAGEISQKKSGQTTVYELS